MGRGEQLSCLGHNTPLAPHRYTAASVIDTASKYKLLWKLPLEDADIIKGGAASGPPQGSGYPGSPVRTVTRLAAYPSSFALWGLIFPSRTREVACRISLPATEPHQDHLLTWRDPNLGWGGAGV